MYDNQRHQELNAAPVKRFNLIALFLIKTINSNGMFLLSYQWCFLCSNPFSLITGNLVLLLHNKNACEMAHTLRLFNFRYFKG